jgi:hypothetical protein
VSVLQRLEQLRRLESIYNIKTAGSVDAESNDEGQLTMVRQSST